MARPSLECTPPSSRPSRSRRRPCRYYNPLPSVIPLNVPRIEGAPANKEAPRPSRWQLLSFVSKWPFNSVFAAKRIEHVSRNMPKAKETAIPAGVSDAPPARPPALLAIIGLRLTRPLLIADQIKNRERHDAPSLVLGLVHHAHSAFAHPVENSRLRT